MKKTFALLLIAAMMLANCGENPPQNNAGKENPQSDTAVAKSGEPNTTVAQGKTEKPEASIVMLGTWEGTMSGKKLSIVIEAVGENTVSGYNILGNTRRDIKGTFTVGGWDIPCAKAFDATLSEPGDDKNDGVFSVKFVGYEDLEELDGGPECKGNLKGVEGVGSWKANVGGKVKEFNLDKKN